MSLSPHLRALDKPLGGGAAGQRRDEVGVVLRERVVRPETGVVAWDGVDIAGVDAAALHERVAVVL